MKYIHKFEDGEIVVSDTTGGTDVEISVRSLNDGSISKAEKVEITNDEYTELDVKSVPNKTKRLKIANAILLRDNKVRRNN